MVIRCNGLMGVPGGVYVLSSWLALAFAFIGLPDRPFYTCVSGLCLVISFLLGWLIDQRRWLFPVAYAPRAELSAGGLTDREILRSRIHCWLAGMCRSVALGICLAGLHHFLSVAASGGPW